MHSLISKSDLYAQNFDKNYCFTDEEANALNTKLNKDIRSLCVERYYADPPIYGQKLALISFVPSSGAKPDDQGWYGTAKVRYVAATPEEADVKARELIEKVDSLHKIYTVNVGKVFPITESSIYSEQVNEVDVRKKATHVISEDILKRKKQTNDDMKQVEQKEKELIEKSKKAEAGESIEPFEEYINMNVRRSQLIWTYVETMKKIKQMKQSYDEAIKIIKKYDETEPTFKDDYKEKYFEARREAGIKDDEESFLKYMNMDLEVDWNELL